jgi:CRISPR system Cascade subunit CasE
MYLSSLLIDLGANPDHPRPGRQWLRNPYRVHQRLCMAFPSSEALTQDPDFLQPFCPEHFGQQVHVARGAEAGFLFRTDPLPRGRAVILVQSSMEPDWGYAFSNATHLLAAPAQVKPFSPTFATGQLLQFRLRANPTRKLSGRGAGAKQGKRVGIYDRDEQLAWLSRKGEAGGFSVASYTIVAEGKRTHTKGSGDKMPKMPLLAVCFDGVLQVTDPDALRATVEAGVGSGKAFGFGLLSLARA